MEKTCTNPSVTYPIEVELVEVAYPPLYIAPIVAWAEVKVEEDRIVPYPNTGA